MDQTETGRASIPDEQTNERVRLLVVAADEHVAEPLEREIERVANGRDPEVKIVAPALARTRFEHSAGAVDEGMSVAQTRLGRAEDRVAHDARIAAGTLTAEEVGDADPILAIDDALANFHADELLLVTHSQGDGRWLEDDMFEQVRRRFAIPVTHFEIQQAGEAVETERADGTDVPAMESTSRSGNLAGLDWRERLGILVAIVGTIVLIVIASAGNSLSADTDLGQLHLSSQVIRIAIAGLMALINIGNVVGLILFSSVGYRGFWQRAFAHTSLWGTLIAIPVALIV